MPKVPDYESFRRIIDKVSCTFGWFEVGSWFRLHDLDAPV